jgi:MFS transporter, DHA2 family, multidrug resistance protein
LFKFVTSGVMYASLALLPPMLTMMGYPAVTTGELMAPRGVATMICMIIVGRLIGRVDIRLLLTLGLSLVALSLWEMAGYSPGMDDWPVIWAGLLQGAGLGFVFVPLSTIAFSTLPPVLRAEGSGIFSLLRNIGGSIGISASVALLSQNTQVSHAELGAHITRFAPALRHPALAPFWSLDSTAGLAALDQAVNAQAAMIAYINDFKMMMIVCLVAMPLVLLLRPVRQTPGAAAPME